MPASTDIPTAAAPASVQLTLVSAENGFRDYDVAGAEIHRVTFGFNLKKGDMFNVYGPDSTKRGGTWQGSIKESVSHFLGGATVTVAAPAQSESEADSTPARPTSRGA